MRIYLILLFTTLSYLSQAQIGIRYDNEESTGYSSSMKSDDFTYLVWDRNHGGDSHYESSVPMFMYWDNDESVLGYLVDTQNMNKLNASFYSLIVSNGFSLTGTLDMEVSNEYYALDIRGDGQDVRHYSYNDVGPGNRPDYNFYRAKGTEASPGNVVNDDQLGTVTWLGYNGGFKQAASIRAVVDGSPATGFMPTKLEFQTSNNTVALQTHMILDANGNLGLGTTETDAKLTVKGDIHAEKVTVDLNFAAPDYVFESDYDLMTLSETEAYINENKHLPEVPSADQLAEKGIDLVEMNMLLLKKVEELTLHVISLQNQVEELNAKR